MCYTRAQIRIGVFPRPNRRPALSSIPQVRSQLILEIFYDPLGPKPPFFFKISASSAWSSASIFAPLEGSLPWFLAYET